MVRPVEKAPELSLEQFGFTKHQGKQGVPVRFYCLALPIVEFPLGSDQQHPIVSNREHKSRGSERGEEVGCEFGS